MTAPKAEGRRMIAYIAGIILIIALISFGASQCAKQRNMAAQARLDASQAEAAQNSAKDAIGTVARSGDAQAASEQLTRDSERAIRAAPGAEVRISPEVQGAGLRALCQRSAYVDAPRCAPFRKEVR